MFRVFWLIAAVLVLVGQAQAHRLNESYVYFNVTDDGLSGRIEATFTDINKVVDLDRDGDGAVTDAEFEAKIPEVQAYFAERLAFSSNGTSLIPVFTDVRYLEIDVDTFALMAFDLPELTATPDAIDMEYRFLFDTVETTHRGFAIIESNTRTGVENNEAQFSLIFGPGEERQSLSLIGRPWPEIFVEFIEHGIWHILIGYDHILFIVTLLLASVLVLRNNTEWVPTETFGAAFWTVAKIVTLFTVAHTITLSLAALGIIQLPIVLVEAVIALSIAIVALDNIFPLFHRRAWLVVFLFGLFHGLGFANVLAPLGVDQNAKTVALVGFNLGVEIGQLAIVAVVFPVLFLLRRWSLYVPLVLKVGSAGLIAIALFWFIERTFDIFGNVTAAIFGGG